MKKIFISLFLLAIILFSCSNTKAEKEKSTDEVTTKIINGEIVIPIPPVNLSTRAQKAEFILMNFWNPLDFNDTIYTRNKDFLEQNFANFISLLPYADPEDRKKAIFKLLDKAQNDQQTFDDFMEIAELYLYDTHSPLMNEESYIPFMEYVIDSKTSSDYDREIAAYTLQSINKNKRGTIATDFNFIDRNGVISSLHQTFSDRDIMLIFYDPNCENCKQTITELQNDTELNRNIDQGKIGILAIYSGHNKSLWLRSLNDMPTNWIIGYDNGVVEDEEIFDLRSMPTIYLLKADKTVIEKNLRR